MSFLWMEKEKLLEWWEGISRRELLFYALGAFLLLGIVFSYYAILGVTGLFQWVRALRSAGECLVLLFLTQLMTGKNLLHPFWRIGYIPFFSWVFIFPYVILHAVNGNPGAAFNALSPYFLTAMAILLILFFMMNVISKVIIGKRLAMLICLSVGLFFTVSAFIFLIHYLFMGIMMTPRETFFALTHTDRWLTNVVLRHVGALNLFLMGAGTAIFTWWYGKWIYKSAYELPYFLEKKQRPPDSKIHRLVQFLVFFGCAWLLVRWAAECFPLHDIEIARQYETYIDFINNAAL